jgi:hypothetical protein
MKALIFDSGALINLSMNGLLDILERLQKRWSGVFLITPQVKSEIVDRPLKIHRFELGALRIQQLFNQGLLKLPEKLNINSQELLQVTRHLLEKANHALQIKGSWLEIVSEAEMSCIALASLLNKKGVETLIAIDERTTRTLCESPRMLEQLISERMHKWAKIAGTDFSEFREYRFIRSSELVYVAHKKGLLGIEGKQALEAALYATKSKGAAISYEEIEALKKL